eukprot:769898-Rhodomonas_salina.2
MSKSVSPVYSPCAAVVLVGAGKGRGGCAVWGGRLGGAAHLDGAHRETHCDVADEPEQARCRHCGGGQVESGGDGVVVEIVHEQRVERQVHRHGHG